MNFLGCEGIWLLHEDGSTVCDGQLQTFTVQEMRDHLAPSMTGAQKAQLGSAIIVFFVLIWVAKRLRNI